MNNKGILYITAGTEFTKAALRSARTVREVMPELPIHLFHDGDSSALLNEAASISFFTSAVIENPHRRSKIDYLPLSPFEQTLYLDSDTELAAPIDDVFELLNRFDVALAHAHRRNTKQTEAVWNVEIPQAFPQFNGGVIAYRKTDAVLQFLNDWRDAFHQANIKKDQVTLRELLWSGDLRIATLPPEYNIRYDKYLEVWDEVEAKPRILHYKRFHENT
jgi:hypothetical protein